MKQFGHTISETVREVTVLISLNDGRELDVTDFPALKDLGTWVVTDDHCNLRLRTKLGQPQVAQQFSEITGLPLSAFTLGAISSINAIW